MIFVLKTTPLWPEVFNVKWKLLIKTQKTIWYKVKNKYMTH